MRFRLVFSFTLIIGFNVLAQTENRPLLYDPGADALMQIDSAVTLANKENKNVLIQVGGNWCSWCIKLHNFVEAHAQIDSIIKADYVLIRVNYSKENPNPAAMQRLDYPNRFGFPVLVILDGKGNRIHTQNTAYLEENKSYSETKLKEFLLSWNIRAIDPKSYTQL